MDKFKATVLFLLILPCHSGWSAATIDRRVVENWQPEAGQPLTGEKSQADSPAAAFCLIPSEPGCSAMWQKETQQENRRRIERHEEKQLYRAEKR